MQCPRGEFEDEDTKCKACPTGTDCSKAGITLSTLPVKEGFWRTSARSSDVRMCELGVAACRGSLVVNTHEGSVTTVNGDLKDASYTNSTDYCHKGYEGPICNTCSRKYFKNWAKLTCDLCKDMAKKGP